MKNSIRLAAALVAVAGFTTSANAAATASATAKAEILTSISIAKDTGGDLSFGQIAVNGAGTVYVDAANATSDTCNGLLVCTGTMTRGAFTVSGTPGVTVTASVVESTLNLTDSASDTMTITGFNSGFVGASGSTLDSSGKASFHVGGTLSVSATQPVGVYSGTFNVTAEYQ